jgi:hypothetical protein
MIIANAVTVKVMVKVITGSAFTTVWRNRSADADEFAGGKVARIQTGNYIAKRCIPKAIHGPIVAAR